MRKILPVHEPLSATYSHTAHVLSIIGNNTIVPWWMNCFIQIYGECPDFLDYQDFWFTECPILHTQHIGRDMVLIGWHSMADFVRDAIAHEYYVYAEVNINCIGVYHASHGKSHDALIYGFDDDRQEYLIADFFDDKRYSSAWVSYQEVEKALLYDEQIFGGTGIFFDDIYLLKEKQDAEAVFAPDKVRDSIERYLERTPMIYGYNRFKPYSVKEVDQYLYGLDCYKLLLRMASDSGTGEPLPMRWRQVSHLMYEHKKIMCSRIQYMEERGILKYGDHYLRIFQDLAEEMLMTRNLLLRYSITQRADDLKRIHPHIDRVCKAESEALSDLAADIIVS